MTNWPILGHLPAYLPDKLNFLTRAAQAGGTPELQLGERTLLLTTPGDIQHVLTGNPGNYTKSPRLTSERGKRLSGRGMQTAVGAEHLRQRRLLQPAFHPRSIEPFYELMQVRTTRHLAAWRPGQTRNVSEDMEQLALSIIIGSMFGPDTLPDEAALARAITHRRAYLEFFYSSLFPFPEYLPLPVVFRFRRARRTIDASIAHALAAKPGSGFAAMFAAMRYPDGGEMTFPQQRDELLTLMSTGYETIGDALTWTLYLLAQHPQVEAAVLEELARELPAGGSLPDASTVPRLRYLRQVIEESLRLYPPTWIFIRMAVDHDRLPSGARVEPGTKIYLCPWVTHRDPRYFPDPLRFVPERARPRFAYFPFGAGQRTCIGEQFAFQEATVILAMLLPRFRCEVPAGHKLTLQSGITLRACNGLPLRILAR